ncbi:hypothetical protein SB725_29245 [Pseudomonas sp. SIMBA_041]|uniref:hypothetical protein n=1 Tax=unclassified Pseudomonas TaxID=196821 RepID=UPI000721FDE1|nr:hypothetical protein [Pseudomonas sp. URMO17WK12:I11]CRL52078.1 hypothetical protein PSHI_52820 [Pseudomonas sp. URMO17WK12:I11]
MNEDTQSSTPSFAEARPLDEKDALFIGELCELLKRHENTERFGLFLLHDHFTMNRDEILLESNDPDARTLHMEVVKRENLPEGKFTSWRLGGTRGNKVEALTFCGRICY